MSGKAAEMGAEESWSEDVMDDEEMSEFDMFEDEIDDEIETFGEPGPNTREQFEELDEREEALLWEDE